MPDRHATGSFPAAMPASVMFYLVAAMAAGTFTSAIFSVLGTFVVDEFAISRAELGLVVAVNTVTGGIVSPYIGRVVDRLGGGYSLQLLFMMSAVSFALTAISPIFLLVLLAALIGGVAQAFANPATNKVIAYRAPLGSRATVTGVKQSGVQFALFFGGISLPTLATWFGWRWAFTFVAALAVAGAFGVYRSRHGTSSGAGERHLGGPPGLSGAARWLAAYGLLMGFSSSALFFLPLYAEEELGQSVQVGGLAVALAGLTAVIGRILWARFADNGARHRLALAIIAGLAVAGPVILDLAETTAAFLWVGAVVVGASASSWNSVGMLAIIDDSKASGAGSASGWVLFGFLIGLGVAPPIYGRTYDISGSYVTMWSIAAVTAAIALALMLAWVATERRAATL